MLSLFRQLTRLEEKVSSDVFRILQVVRQRGRGITNRPSTFRPIDPAGSEAAKLDAAWSRDNSVRRGTFFVKAFCIKDDFVGNVLTKGSWSSLLEYCLKSKKDMEGYVVIWVFSMVFH